MSTQPESQPVTFNASDIDQPQVQPPAPATRPAGQPAGRPVTFNVSDIDSGVNSGGQSQPPQSLWDKTKSAAGDVASTLGNAAVGAGETLFTQPVATIARAISPNSAIAQQFSAAAAPQGKTGESAGRVVGEIEGFLAGDQAFNALPWIERAEEALKVGKVLAKYPTLRTALRIGMQSGAGGAIVTGQQKLEGQPTDTALQTGLAATAGGVVLGSAAAGANALARRYLSTGALQKPLQDGIRRFVGAAADDAGVARSVAPSIRDTAEETADAVYAKSKSQYKTLDDATGGRFQRFKDRLDNIRQALNNLTGTEEDMAQEAKLLKAQKETEDGMQEVFADAKAKGVDPKLIDEANANFKKSQALYDLDSTIKKATSGGRPGVTPANLLDKARETVDPKKFLNRVNSMYDSGGLQDALGEQGADGFFNHAVEHGVAHSKVLRNQTIGKYAAGAIGLGTLSARELYLLGVRLH